MSVRRRKKPKGLESCGGPIIVQYSEMDVLVDTRLWTKCKYCEGAGHVEHKDDGTDPGRGAQK